MLHDKTVKDNASSRFLLVHHTCVVSLFSPGVIKLCACLFLDLFHTIYRNTRVLFGSFIITKLSSKCGVFAFLFGFILFLNNTKKNAFEYLQNHCKNSPKRTDLHHFSWFFFFFGGGEGEGRHTPKPL